MSSPDCCSCCCCGTVVCDRPPRSPLKTAHGCRRRRHPLHSGRTATTTTTITMPLLLLLLLFLSTLTLLAKVQAQITLSESTPLTCHLPLATVPITSATSASGIVFPIQSSTGDSTGPRITSFGFHVDPALLPSNYEVYALTQDGYYADPNRENLATTGSLPYDYRGKLEEWTLVASGTIGTEDVALNSAIVSSTTPDYFQIPFEVFNSEATLVPPNGGIKSFYLTLTGDTPSFFYGETTELNLNLNDALPIVANSEVNDPFPPKILVGEGSVTYPFETSAFMYAPKLFVGKAFYEWECASEAPSASSAPSGMPTAAESGAPSGVPSVSYSPSAGPTAVASDAPSMIPSGSPTVLSFPVSTGMLLSLEVVCNYDENGEEVELTEEEKATVAETVKATSAADAAASNVVNVEVEVTGITMNCVVTEGRRRDRERRHLQLVDNHFNRTQRILPTASSSVDFSMVITGEYRPIVRPGEAPPNPNDLGALPDLGKLAEDSINRNPEQFVKDLVARQPEGSTSTMSQTQSFEAKAMPAPEAPIAGQPYVEVKYTRAPTYAPTNAPTATPTKDDSFDSILLIAIIITGGIIVTLGAVLLYRHAERKAVSQRKKMMERIQQEKHEAKLEKQRKREWEEENSRRGGGGNGGMSRGSEESWGDDKGQFKNKMVSYPPAPGYPPNVYGGMPPPMNQEQMQQQMQHSVMQGGGGFVYPPPGYGNPPPMPVGGSNQGVPPGNYNYGQPPPPAMYGGQHYGPNFASAPPQGYDQQQQQQQQQRLNHSMPSQPSNGYHDQVNGSAASQSVL